MFKDDNMKFVITHQFYSQPLNYTHQTHTYLQEFAKKSTEKSHAHSPHLLPQCQQPTGPEYTIKTKKLMLTESNEQVQISLIIHASICVCVYTILYNFVTHVALYNHHQKSTYSTISSSLPSIPL